MADKMRVDYEALNQVKGKLGAVSDSLEGITSAINAATGPIREGAWRGEAFDSFQKEYQQTAPAHAALRAAIGEAENKLDAIVKLVREAEAGAKGAG